MSLQDQVMTEMKTAMKAKDKVALESLRAIKSALLLMQTENGSGEAISEDAEIQLVQKLVKQRRLGSSRIRASSYNRKIFARAVIRRRDRESCCTDY